METTKKKINPKEFVNDLRAGLGDQALMAKYQLTPRQLQRFLRKLQELGILKPKEGSRRVGEPTMLLVSDELPGMVGSVTVATQAALSPQQPSAPQQEAGRPLLKEESPIAVRSVLSSQIQEVPHPQVSSSPTAVVGPPSEAEAPPQGDLPRDILSRERAEPRKDKPHRSFVTKSRSRLIFLGVSFLLLTLLAGGGVYILMGWHSSPLIVAVRDARIGDIQNLLEKGASIERRDFFKKESALGVAVGSPMGLPALQLFLERGANINAAGDAEDSPPLVIAAKASHALAVQVLLEKGAQINATDRFKQTALMHAADRGAEDILEILLQKGADVRARDAAGGTAMSRAAAKGLSRTVKILQAHGGDINEKDPHGETLLSRAAATGNLILVQFLVAHGADPYLKNRQERAPIDIAQRHGHTHVVEWLKLNLEEKSPH